MIDDRTLDAARMPPRIHDIVADGASRHRDRAAFDDGGRVLTYGDLGRAVDRRASELASLGVRAGDRVLVVAENDADVFALLFAASRLDACLVPVSARLVAAEIDAIAAHCDPRLAFYAAASSAPAAAHAARREARADPALSPDAMLVERFGGDPAREPVSAGGEDVVAAMLYTSGTTGAPRAVMLSHANLLHLARTQSVLRHYRHDDRVYLALPIAYAGALASITLTTLCAGGCLCLRPRFTPADLARALRDDGITVVFGVPSTHAQCAAWAEGHPGEFAAPRLRMATSAAAPLDLAVKAKAEALYGVPLQNGYGLTETTAVVCQTSLDEWRRDLSVGRPFPGTSIRIVDDAGVDVAAEEVGEILVRGPNVFAGYFRDPEATRAAFAPGGWFRTGDLGRLGTAGELTIVARLKELIKCGGYTVQPGEVEAAIAAHPAVARCAVVGRPLGASEAIVAFVELAEGASATVAALRAFAAARLAEHRRPALVRIVSRLPLLASGKVDREALRRRARDGG